jgi:hypothetical protein
LHLLTTNKGIFHLFEKALAGLVLVDAHSSVKFLEHLFLILSQFGGDHYFNIEDLVASAGLRQQVRIPALSGWYPTCGSPKPGGLGSMPPTYPVQKVPKSNVKLQ